MSTNANERQVGGRHYKVSFEHWDLCWELKLGHLPSAITKYATRHSKKNGREDVEKALHYADKYLEVIGRVETPFPRVFEHDTTGGFEGTRMRVAAYEPEVAAYVQREVVRYCAANELGLKESAIIAFLCHPHDGSAVREVQELLKSILVDEYKVPEAEVYGEQAPLPNELNYQVVGEDTGEEGNGPHGFGYVNQDRSRAETGDGSSVDPVGQDGGDILGVSTLRAGDGDFRTLEPKSRWPFPD